MVQESQSQGLLYYLGLSIVGDRNTTRINLSEIALGIFFFLFSSEEKGGLSHVTQFVNLFSVYIHSFASVIQSVGFNSGLQVNIFRPKDVVPEVYTGMSSCMWLFIQQLQINMS